MIDIIRGADMSFFPRFTRMTVKQFGFSDVILDLLAQCFSRKPDEIKVCAGRARWVLSPSLIGLL